jgi:hypothetical protein
MNLEKGDRITGVARLIHVEGEERPEEEVVVAAASPDEPKADADSKEVRPDAAAGETQSPEA